MYSLSDLKTAIRHPRNIPREFNRWYYMRFRSRDYNIKASNVFDKDWDNLILLDACRYDAFNQIYKEQDLDGELEATHSRGSATMEFLEANVPDRDLADTIYVTGTSMLYRMTEIDGRFEHNFHDVINVWRDADLEGQNASPDQMVDATQKAADKYPNKRLLIHFIQPHIPFVGEFGQSEFGEVNGSVWRQTRRGNLDTPDEALWRAYYENLEYVLPSVRKLLSELAGKTVVSSDHGQLIGERLFPIPIKDYGHPNGIYADELVKVPWLVSERGERKNIVAEPPQVGDDRQSLDEAAKNVLNNLGYLQE